MLQVRRGDSQHLNKCAFWQNSDDNIVAAVCNNADGNGNSQSAPSMYWTFVGETIKNDGAGTSKCLQCGNPADSANNGVGMANCDGSDNQKWRWWAPGDAWTSPW
jgi:hypothetical protein